MVFIPNTNKRVNKVSLGTMGRLYLFLAVTSMISMASGVFDTTFCNLTAIKSISPAPQTPKLPEQFSMRVECDFMDRYQTMDIHEYFDFVNNRAAIHSLVDGKKTQAIFDYGTNELITLIYSVDGGPPACRVDNLVKSTAVNLFGIFQLPNGTNHIYTAANALRFGENTPKKYIGQRTIREGILTDAWRSCLYWSARDITMEVTWYFTASRGWSSPMGIIQPIQCDVNGVDHSNGTDCSFSQSYIFSDFQPHLPADDLVSPFETPPGTYCQDRASTVSLPNITSYFTFSAEIIKPSEHYVNYIKEYYNYDLNLVRYDYRANPTEFPQVSSHEFNHLHDFNTGVDYIIDTITGQCTASPINNQNFDSKPDDSVFARIRTKKEFFNFDSSLYQYAGKRTVRKIECDVWTTRRNDFPINKPLPVTIWEWYFATASWKESVGLQFENSVPVMLQITSYPTLNIIYNIYEYSEDQPRIWETDITTCYNYTNQEPFQFTLPGTYQNDVAANEWSFKLSVIQTIVSAAHISPIRIQYLGVDYDKDNVLVNFIMLDKAPIAGDSKYQSADIPLSQAATALTTAIKSRQFIVQLNPKDFPNIKTLTANPNSVNPTNRPVSPTNRPVSHRPVGPTNRPVSHRPVSPTNRPVSHRPVSPTNRPISPTNMLVNPTTVVTRIKTIKTGYSGGSMAGLGIGMLIVSILVSFGVLYLVVRFRGRGFKRDTPFQFENKVYYNAEADDDC